MTCKDCGMIVRQEMIKKGKLTPDGRNKQAVFFGIFGVKCTPDGMTEDEEKRYWAEAVG